MAPAGSLQPTAVSAPGKVLLAGGYLVLDRDYTGLVFGLDARIHVCVDPIQTEEGVTLSEIIVTSPQFVGAVWEFGYRLVEADGGIELTQLRRYVDILPVCYVSFVTFLLYALLFSLCSSIHFNSRHKFLASLRSHSISMFPLTPILLLLISTRCSYPGFSLPTISHHHLHTQSCQSRTYMKHITSLPLYPPQSTDSPAQLPLRPPQQEPLHRNGPHLRPHLYILAPPQPKDSPLHHLHPRQPALLLQPRRPQILLWIHRRSRIPPI